MSELQNVDPEVSRAKFDREIAWFRAQEASYRAQGCFLLEAAFPKVFVVFAATKVKPAVIPAAIEIDFSNYDLRPPSVVFVDPFTRTPVMRKDLALNMFRRPSIPGTPSEVVATLIQQGSVQPVNIIQANSLNDPPFLCLPGIREYHDNPAHTGDSWLLHRASGAGSLAFILDKILTYGTRPVEQFMLQIQTQAVMMAVSLHAMPD